jgi:hypothetical protein
MGPARPGRPKAKEGRKEPEATVGMPQGGHRVGGEHHRATQDPVIVAPGPKILHGRGAHENVRDAPVRK